MTHSRRQILDLLDRYDLRPSRALGQNFVADANTVRRIARLADVGPGDHVVEIGAGLGSLTLALAETGAAVTAVELDRHILPALREAVDGSTPAVRVRIIEGDALTLDWACVLSGAPIWTLVANLPYNVATPLICDLLDFAPQITRMLVMVQLEVADRLAAHPGDKAYGIPSVKVGYWASARVVGKVGPDVFVPRPRVDSALVEIVRRPEGPAIEADAERLFALVRAGFAHRRKMLRGALAGLVDTAGFAAAGVEPTARAEQLDLEAWGRLARLPVAPA